MDDQHTTVLFPYEPEELWRMIRELLRSELQRAKIDISKSVTYEVPGMTKKPLYKAHEVCEMLQISRQTLHAWNKEGILKPYKIKSRVYYLWNDLEKLMKAGEHADTTD